MTNWMRESPKYVQATHHQSRLWTKTRHSAGTTNVINVSAKGVRDLSRDGHLSFMSAPVPHSLIEGSVRAMTAGHTRSFASRWRGRLRPAGRDDAPFSVAIDKNRQSRSPAWKHCSGIAGTSVATVTPRFLTRVRLTAGSPIYLCEARQLEVASVPERRCNE